MSQSKLHVLTEIAIFSAIALVFDKLPLFTMPQGGSVSLVMLPILLLSLRHGWLVGILSGLIVGTIQLFYGGYFLNVFQVFLDYVLSYAGIGIAGLFAPTLHRNTTLSKASITIMSANFLAGIIFYADYAPADTPVWIYSFTYNISYILPSTVIACILLILLYKARPNFFRG